MIMNGRNGDMELLRHFLKCKTVHFHYYQVLLFQRQILQKLGQTKVGLLLNRRLFFESF